MLLPTGSRIGWPANSIFRVAKSRFVPGLRWAGTADKFPFCRFGGDPETASSRKGPFGKPSGFGRDNHFGGLLKGRGGS